MQQVPKRLRCLLNDLQSPTVTFTKNNKTHTASRCLPPAATQSQLHYLLPLDADWGNDMKPNTRGKMRRSTSQGVRREQGRGRIARRRRWRRRRRRRGKGRVSERNWSQRMERRREEWISCVPTELLTPLGDSPCLCVLWVAPHDTLLLLLLLLLLL